MPSHRHRPAYRSFRLAALHGATLLVVAGFASGAARAADVAAGKRTAERWCASCHVVSNTQAKARSDAPSFASISRKRKRIEIKGFLGDDHPNMPNMSLTREEVTNLIAYMQSLAPPLDPPKPKPEKDKPPKEYRG